METPTAPTIVKMPPPRSTEPAPRILILDDEEAICSLLSAVLTPLGCDVVETTSSAAAFAACEESVRNGKRFALVISDLSLAEKLTGIETVALLKKIDPQLRAIITTGHNAEPILLRYREHGFIGALSKPYEIAKIERLVFQILAQPTEQLKTA
jgi:CheY-like chemotaxis protein